MTMSAGLPRALSSPHRCEDAIIGLRCDPLLAALSTSAREALLTCGQIRHYHTGERIHGKHDRSEHLYRILSGAVRISSVSPEGREAIFNYYGPRDWFGLIGLLDGAPRTHDIHACGPCTLFIVPRHNFQALAADYAEFYRVFALQLCRMMRRAYTMLEDQATLGLSSRLAKQLINLVDAYGTPHEQGRMIDLHMSQEDLSLLLGSTRQTINKKLAQWARLGWIVVNYSEIVIVNREALCQLYAP
ncbi:Crp/Fnr family transcriptional regulator [Phytohalomonas tamaricis]|uniref:Crp/Fnr family transcriptional regulator n=1 Tax=Phytohalomonas tamaricis TaxID=2081032 RepID=UPI001319C6E2|nr:Crp/Fnr family transcriptional regulator [Phytohalomonas tamaricis]